MSHNFKYFDFDLMRERAFEEKDNQKRLHKRIILIGYDDDDKETAIIKCIVIVWQIKINGLIKAIWFSVQ